MIFLAFLGIYCIFTLGQPWEKPRGNVNYIINSLRNGGKNGESCEGTDVVSCFSKEWIIPFYGAFLCFGLLIHFEGLLIHSMEPSRTFWLTKPPNVITNPFYGTFQNISALWLTNPPNVITNPFCGTF